MKKFPVLAIAALLGLSACGSDSDSGSSETTAAASVETTAAAAVETTAAAAADTTAAAAVETTAAAAADTTAAAAAPAAAAGFKLVEWALEGSNTLTAGQNDFTVANGGRNGHEFLIIKGTYADLPKNELGTVQEDQLAEGSVLFEIEKIEPGADAPVSVDLPAGAYTFLCNIEFGPNSHAGKGQVLDVTVA